MNEIQMSAEDALRNYMRSDGGKTPYLREVAEAFIDAREHFFTADGSVDWLGRTHAYRQWVSETLSNARVAPGDTTSTLAAIRYHTGNVLRTRLDDEQLEDLGLRKPNSKERAAEVRAQAAEVRHLFGAGSVIHDPQEMLQAVRLMTVTLRRIDADELSDAAPGVRADIAGRLAEIRERADELSAAAGATSRPGK
ncbi:hypothetical protein [Herbiconiux moechotypicola]|uniref:hypothetical protein n=1 Tax=Herbiconiux moechotypicola TaxID=637393 RepID=UPI0031DCE882